MRACTRVHVCAPSVFVCRASPCGSLVSFAESSARSTVCVRVHTCARVRACMHACARTCVCACCTLCRSASACVFASSKICLASSFALASRASASYPFVSLRVWVHARARACVHARFVRGRACVHACTRALMHARARAPTCWPRLCACMCAYVHVRALTHRRPCWGRLFYTHVYTHVHCSPNTHVYNRYLCTCLHAYPQGTAQCLHTCLHTCLRTSAPLEVRWSSISPMASTSACVIGMSADMCADMCRHLHIFVYRSINLDKPRGIDPVCWYVYRRVCRYVHEHEYGHV